MNGSSNNNNDVDGNNNARSTLDPFCSGSPGKSTYHLDNTHTKKPQSTRSNRCYPENFSPIIPLKLKPREEKYTPHPKYKAQLIDQEVADNPANLNTMPTEVLEEILSYISFKQRMRLQRTSKRIKEITLNTKFWESIKIKDSKLRNSVMQDIIETGTTSLNIPNCDWTPSFREVFDIENFRIEHLPKFTYLGLQGYRGNEAIIATIIFLSKDLISLDISESKYALISTILNKLDRTNQLKTINLASMENNATRIDNFTGRNVQSPQIQQHIHADQQMYQANGDHLVPG